MRQWTLLIAFVATGLVLAAPARAAFHLMKIVEVFPGAPASPNAQFVVLQMYSGGQSFVAGHSIQVYNSADSLVGYFTFSGNVSNGANQARILIATAEASAFFGVSANLTMSPKMSLSGGKICFDNIDCVAWGDYAGPSAGVGTPFNAPYPIQTARAIIRRLNITGSPTVLDFGDDTDDSANDFRIGIPGPKNNAGQAGVVPASICGNGVLEGLEQCDDNNSTGGDACSAVCDLVGVGDLPAGELGRILAMPNPFRGDVTLRFALSRAGETEVGIYDLAGRLVRRLQRATLPPGSHQLAWDGRDDAGRVAGAGVYAVRVRSNGLSSSTRLVRLR